MSLFSWSPRRWAENVNENAGRLANHRWAPGLVLLMELVGCVIFPVPVALALVGLVTAAPRKWVAFALGATGGSILGGTALYLIGRWFFTSLGEPLIQFYGTEGRWASVVDWFNGEWGISFVLLAGVTTGMFRVASLGAGFTGMNPAFFLGLLFLSRGARFLAECGAIRFVGDRVRTMPGRYFRYAAAGTAIAFLAALLIVSLTA